MNEVPNHTNPINLDLEFLVLDSRSSTTAISYRSRHCYVSQMDFASMESVQVTRYGFRALLCFHCFVLDLFLTPLVSCLRDILEPLVCYVLSTMT